MKPIYLLIDDYETIRYRYRYVQIIIFHDNDGGNGQGKLRERDREGETETETHAFLTRGAFGGEWPRTTTTTGTVAG